MASFLDPRTKDMSCIPQADVEQIVNHIRGEVLRIAKESDTSVDEIPEDEANETNSDNELYGLGRRVHYHSMGSARSE